MTWPDWSGETAVIVGTGPSAKDAPLHLAKGMARIIVIKRSWMLAPWADLLYGVDPGWWIANHGAPEFKGMKVSPSPTACRVFGLRQVRLRPRAEILKNETGVLGCGLKSSGGFAGFQAMNLAFQFGAKRQVLVGFDMTLQNGSHWHDDRRGVGKPDRDRTESWRKSLDGCAEHFKAIGLDVINASMGSRLAAFPKMDLAAAL